MLGHQLDRLGLGPMVARNREVQRTDFAITVDAAEGISTGVSAYDRSVAIKLLADPLTRPDQLVQPGHVFPLRARPGGVLERAGHTEAAVDLAMLAGLEPCGVICELVNDDGTMRRLPQLVEFKHQFGLKMISIEQLISYRLKQDKLVEKVGERAFASAYGDFTAHVFRSRLDKRHHLALTLGRLDDTASIAPLVRVHSANVLADVFRGLDCGTPGDVLDSSLRAIAAEGRGAVLYMEPLDSGATLLRRLAPGPTAEAAPGMGLRDYGIGAQILGALGLKKIRLLSNSHRKLVGLEAYGIELIGQVEVPPRPNA
jgi:3,4-dihydroxy 2-butanone 4-phosphate synthase/GTP cyclohydrolase II